MAFAVDEEAVVAEAALGRLRLELREVDGARRELLQDREKRTGTVGALEADDRRLVVTRRRGDPASDDDEARLILGVILDLRRKDLEAVQLGGEAVADRGLVAPLRLGDVARGIGGRERGAHIDSGQLLGEPAATLRGGVRERRDPAANIEGDAGWGAEGSPHPPGGPPPGEDGA